MRQVSYGLGFYKLIPLVHKLTPPLDLGGVMKAPLSMAMTMTLM